MNCESTKFNFQDVLLLIGLKEITGDLTLESGNDIGHMQFYRGRILQAMSPYSRAIGDLLVEEGLITETELIETLQLQRKNPVSPIGSLLLKTGKVSFEILESMVHEQIRQSVKEFKTWENISLSFHEKDIEPPDRIHLMIHEFLTAEILKNVFYFFSAECTPHDQSAAPVPSPTMS
jgi:hypothetical protein